MEFAIFIFALIFISVDKHFSPISFLNALDKCAVVIFFVRQLEISLAILLTLFPFSAVDDSSRCIQIDTTAVLEAINPLSIINVAVGELKYSGTILFAVEKLSFIDILLRYDLNAFSMFLSLPRLAEFPSSHVKLSWKMPENAFWDIVSQRKNHTVFVFFDT